MTGENSVSLTDKHREIGYIVSNAFKNPALDGLRARYGTPGFSHEDWQVIPHGTIMGNIFQKKNIGLVLLVVFFLSACGGPGPVAPPAKRVPTPPPSGPSLRVPPTQRPYEIYGKTYYPLPSAIGFVEEGIASWYGEPFHGRPTANGETYNMYAATCAHKTLPMNTMLLVQNLENGGEIVVRVNDRGPFVKDRILDLSYDGAQKIGVAARGTARVRISALGEAVGSRQGNETINNFLPPRNFQEGEFFIQVGAFVEKANAQRLQDRLTSMNKKVGIKKYDRGDSVFYRVQVYSGKSLDQAKRDEREWSEAGFPGAFVVAQ